MKKESLSVRVLSSDGINFYNVEFDRVGTKLAVNCSCAAGERGKVCKHKIGLLVSKEDPDAIETSAEIRAQITDWVNASTYPSLLKDCEDAKAKHLDAKENWDMAKYRLEKAMRDAEGNFLK